MQNTDAQRRRGIAHRSATMRPWPPRETKTTLSVEIDVRYFRSFFRDHPVAAGNARVTETRRWEEFRSAQFDDPAKIGRFGSARHHDSNFVRLF
jgi:hypothetical protein